MRSVRGKVVGGSVMLEAPLPEGSEVEVYVREPGDEVFDLTEEEERDLAEAMAEAERGEVVSAEEVLAGLRARK